MRRRRIMRALAAFEDSWAGAIVGGVCLFGTGYILAVVAGALS